MMKFLKVFVLSPMDPVGTRTAWQAVAVHPWTSPPHRCLRLAGDQISPRHLAFPRWRWRVARFHRHMTLQVRALRDGLRGLPATRCKRESTLRAGHVVRHLHRPQESGAGMSNREEIRHL